VGDIHIRAGLHQVQTHPLDLDAATGSISDRTRVGFAMSSTDVFARLDRIKELWRELERTRRTLPRYEELVAEIHAESLAYQALLIEQENLDRRRARIDVHSKDVDSRVDSKHNTVNRKPVERRPIDRRKTNDRRKTIDRRKK
jgi:hypothetical protein